jgi:hypothetical protein
MIGELGSNFLNDSCANNFGLLFVEIGYFFYFESSLIRYHSVLLSKHELLDKFSSFGQTLNSSLISSIIASAAGI